MQRYAHVKDDIITGWGLTAQQIKNRGVRLDMLMPMQDAPLPAHNAVSEYVIEVAPALNDAGEPVQQWQVLERGIEDIRATLTDRLANLRWQRETGGISLPDGTPVRTDRNTQTQLTGAVVQAQAGVLTEVRWKLENGFVTLTAAQLLGIATAVAAHVARCFAAEEVVTTAITAAETTEALKDINLVEAFEAALTEIQNSSAEKEASNA